MRSDPGANWHASEQTPNPCGCAPSSPAGRGPCTSCGSRAVRANDRVSSRVPRAARGLLLGAVASGLLGAAGCASNPVSEPPARTLFSEAEEAAATLEARMQREAPAQRARDPEEVERIEEQSRTEAVRKYRALLADKERLDPAVYEASLLNLGHVVFEQCLARYRKAMRQYDRQYARYESGERSTPPEPPRYDFAPAREIYEAFLRTFPASPHRPEVLYNLAYSHEEEGDLDRAVALYDELALTADESRYGPEVFMRLGEHHFEANDFDRAVEYYDRVLALGMTPFYEKALFKKGWSAYAQDDFRGATEAFAGVLDLRFDARDGSRSDLYKESLEILAKILSETGGAPALEAFLRSHDDPPYGLDLSIQLGRYFQETSRFAEAIATYRNLLQSFPLSEQAPFMEQDLVECLRTERRAGEAEALEASILERYGRDTDWARANPDPELREKVDRLMWETLSRLILQNHRRARQTGENVAFERAIDLYRETLAYFPAGEETYETRFRFAECLFESGRLEEAAVQYGQVAESERFGTYRERAASKRIQCMERLRARNLADMDGVLDAYADYVRMFPASEKTPPLLFKQGEMLFNASRYDEAATTFRKIALAYPDNPEALRARMLELEALFQGARYPELETAAQALIAQGVPLTETQADRAEHLLRFAQFQQAQADQEAGNLAQAAGRFERLANQAPRNEIAPDALFNAAVCYKQAGDWPRAAACFEKLTVWYPQSRHYTESLLAPLPHYEQTGQYDKILAVLNKLHARDPDNEMARETLYKIGKHFYKQGRTGEAMAAFRDYAGKYPEDAARRVEILYLNAQVHEEQGDGAAALEGYRAFLQAVEEARAADPGLVVDPAFLARARFLVIQPVYDSFRAVQLREPLQKNLKRKEALLNRLVDDYLEIAGTGGGDYAVAAAYRVGEVYRDFWQSLLDSEVPAGLSGEERLLYAEMLQQQAAPYLEKAEAAYRVTLEKSRERGVLSPWVLRAYSRLAALDPERFPPLMEDALLWEESWKPKRTLIRRIDRSQPRPFSPERAEQLQSAMNGILQTLHTALQEGDADRARAPLLQAIRRLQLLSEQEPFLYEATFNLGVLYQTLGDPGRAQVEYERALRQNPRIPVAHLNLGILKLQQGRLAEAEDRFREMTELSPQYAGGWYLLGLTRNRTGRYADALEPLGEAIRLLPQFLDPYVELGQALAKLGERERAQQAFEAVLVHDKASPRVLRKLGWALLKAGRNTLAVRAYTRVLDTDEAGYEDWNNIGVAYRRAGDLKAAREALSRAVSRAPARPEAVSNLGRVYTEMQAYERAVSSFTQATHASPPFVPALLNAAVVYGEHREQMEKAVALMEEYVEQGGTRQVDMLEAWISRSREGADAARP